MELSDLNFVAADLESAIKFADLPNIGKMRCEDYSPLIGKLSEQEEKLKDPLLFLAILCSWRLQPDDPNDPFESLYHSSTWKNITNSQWACIQSVIQNLSDDELRGRLSDLIWINEKCHKSARNAVDCYLTSAEKIISSNSGLGDEERLRRAIQLAAFLGKSGQPFSQAINHITKIASNDSLENFTSHYALRILLDFDKTNAKKYYQIAINKIALIRSGSRDFVWERSFLEIAALAAIECKEQDDARSAILEVGKIHEQEAETAKNILNKASHLEMALQAYRRVPQSELERERVHQELLDAQSKFSDEMKPFTGEKIDLSHIANDAANSIKGNNLATGLSKLVLSTIWKKKSDIEQEAEKLIRQFPLAHLFTTIQLSSTGKKAAIAPSGSLGGDEIDQHRLFAEMCRHFKFFCGLKTAAIIEPMRTELLLSHTISQHDIECFLRNSPYIPTGREAFFVIGIHAGLHGRFIEALHVLIPQLENLVRFLFDENGIVTSGYDSKGIQKEHDLNHLLIDQKAEEILGEDLCFALRVIFIERFGYNLRNELSHGMLYPSVFFKEKCVYAWWIIFRIVAGPISNLILTTEETNLIS